MLFILRHDVTLTPWQNIGNTQSFVFPKGTAVQRIGANWAIRDEKTVARITGNAHDARHRYVWVRESDVE